MQIFYCERRGFYGRLYSIQTSNLYMVTEGGSLILSIVCPVYRAGSVARSVLKACAMKCSGMVGKRERQNMEKKTEDERGKKPVNDFSLEEQMKAAKYIGEEIGFSKDIGMEILEVEEGYCKGRIVLEKRHLNPLNTVHGGVFFTLADTICGIAAASAGYGGPTVQGDMDYMRAVRGKEISCTARVVKTGKTLTWVDGIIADDTGREVARTKFIYYRLKEAKHFGFVSRD